MTGAIIPARMSSRRLPGKVLMQLGMKSMLAWVVDAVRGSRRVDQTIVLITSNVEDAAIVNECEKLGVDYWVGSSTRDVLGDFYQIANEFGFDPVVRVTADCPLVSSRLIDVLIDEYNEGCDYCSSVEQRTFPRGVEADVVSYAVLKWMHENLTPERTPYGRYHADYRKHVTLYIRENLHAFTTRSVKLDVSKLRLTVDTRDEYDKMRLLFDLMGDNPSWLGALELIDHDPDLAVLETPEAQTKAKWRVW